MKEKSDRSDVEELELIDKWNSFSLKFSIFYPDRTFSNSMFIQMGKEAKAEMFKAKEAYKWIYQKYGQPMQPY